MTPTPISIIDEPGDDCALPPNERLCIAMSCQHYTVGLGGYHFTRCMRDDPVTAQPVEPAAPVEHAVWPVGQRNDCANHAACESTFAGVGKHDAPAWICPSECPDYARLIPAANLARRAA